jgi:hypothetical protein
MKLPALFSIAVGVSMLGQWTMFLVTGQTPELETEPIAIMFAIAADSLTALALIFAGVVMFLEKPWARNAYLIAAGMLFYTLVISTGYFAQNGTWIIVVMFGVILVFGILGTVQVLKVAEYNEDSK